MALFVLTRTTPLAARVCWDRLTDWPRHGDRIAFTRVSAVTGTGHAVGDVVLARTSLGPLGFDDPMEIVALTPPSAGRDGLCRLEKRGRTVRGWAELRVGDASAAGPGSTATWVEDLHVRGVPAVLDPVVAAASRLVFGRVLDALLGP